MAAVTVSFSGSSVIGREGGLRCGCVGGFVVALATFPLGRRDFTPAQVHLLDRETGPLSFRSGWFACGDALSAACGCLLCKSRLRFIPLHIATVVRCVVSPAATALRLFPRGRASTGEVGAPTCGAPWLRIRSCAACGQSAGSACIAAGHLEPPTTPPSLPEFGEHRTFENSGPRATDTMK